MNTSLNRSSISAIPSDGKPTEDQYIFFSRRFSNQLHAEVLRRFLSEKKTNQLTKKELARRLDKDPAQINRLLAAPSNVEIETYSRLLLALGYLPKVSSTKLTELYRSNYFEPEKIVDLQSNAPPKSSATTGASKTWATFRELERVQ